MNAAQPFLLPSLGAWTEIRDGNLTALELHSRHYSKHHYRDGRSVSRFVGPGQRMVLLSPCARALFVWRKFISKDLQSGVNCAVFRNEGAGQSSDLIRAAMALGWRRWPAERFYTYVNARRVRSSNPGFCFLKAGWRKCGVTKARHLLILEALPEWENMKELQR